MEREVMIRIWDLQEKMREDIEYRELCEKREIMSETFLTTLEGMTREQERAVLEYLGYLLEMHYKTIEYLIR